MINSTTGSVSQKFHKTSGRVCQQTIDSTTGSMSQEFHQTSGRVSQQTIDSTCGSMSQEFHQTSGRVSQHTIDSTTGSMSQEFHQTSGRVCQQTIDSTTGSMSQEFHQTSGRVSQQTIDSTTGSMSQEFHQTSGRVSQQTIDSTTSSMSQEFHQTSGRVCQQTIDSTTGSMSQEFHQTSGRVSQQTIDSTCGSMSQEFYQTSGSSQWSSNQWSNVSGRAPCIANISASICHVKTENRLGTRTGFGKDCVTGKRFVPHQTIKALPAGLISPPRKTIRDQGRMRVGGSDWLIESGSQSKRLPCAHTSVLCGRGPLRLSPLLDTLRLGRGATSQVGVNLDQHKTGYLEPDPIRHAETRTWGHFTDTLRLGRGATSQVGVNLDQHKTGYLEPDPIRHAETRTWGHFTVFGWQNLRFYFAGCVILLTRLMSQWPCMSGSSRPSVRLSHGAGQPFTARHSVQELGQQRLSSSWAAPATRLILKKKSFSDRESGYGNKVNYESNLIAVLVQSGCSLGSNYRPGSEYHNDNKLKLCRAEENDEHIFLLVTSIATSSLLP
ncbi:hypothetical protein RRG08_032525 [Elysia crispata]|uniref:Uncharacterized protein n=1 Tax=Elysia crispata TaxID=231223 RepID=A0AAE1DP15_9GAST|nr:hypothetical protein RRG08_032525 [Elysia crispata]